jgi:hypothetical protein
MSRKLRSDFQIARLAADLHLRHDGDPIAAIVNFCHKKIRDVAREFRSGTLDQLLSAAAASVNTLFIEIHDDADLERVRHEYVQLGEAIFATLREQLTPDVYAITFRRTRPQKGDRLFVSIIDCRGEKGSRAYFSKWHEIAHLLTLTEQARLKFCRTHAEPDTKDPEESLMDIIAGEVGFFPELIRAHVTGPISFEAITALRDQLCPGASHQSSLIGIVKAWPTPCALVEATLALREHEQRGRLQQAFDFRDAPIPALRAVHVTINGPAQTAGLLIPRNMGIPEQSVIHRTYAEGPSSLQADEDLSWWESSNGRRLGAQRVTVRTRRRWNSVDALIIPR